MANVPFMYRFHEEPHDYRRYTPTGIKYLLEEVGNFIVDRVEPIGSTMFIMEHLILERSYQSNVFRKILFFLMIKFLRILRNSNEISHNSPFSYFFIAEKN